MWWRPSGSPSSAAVARARLLEFGVRYFEFTGDAMIKHLVAATVALGTFTFSGANAADLPLPVKPPPPPPAWTWTGCYVGIEGGGAMGNDRVTASAGART